MTSESPQISVLVLSTFPFARARHGGQVRLKNLCSSYAEAGCMVVASAIYTEESYSSADYTAMDIPFPAKSIYRKFAGKDIPFVADFMSGVFAVAQDGGWPAIKRKLGRKFDVIHLEQPWLWDLGKRLNHEFCDNKAVLVYGSENIEAPLKASIFKDYGLEFPEVIQAIESLERRASCEADVVVAITDEELAVLRQWGAKLALMAGNGIESAEVDPKVADKWRRKLPEAPWLLYVASAHPPNFTALNRIFGGSLGCFPPDSRFVIAGSVSEHVYRVFSEGRWAALNHSRLHLLYQLEDEDLAAVRQLAHGFVLPIGSGGGSNLKTAEALFSGSYVVGTPTSFRGFERFRDAAKVLIADNPYAFHDSIRDVLQRPRFDALADLDEPNMRSELLWSSRLKHMVETVIHTAKVERS
ncbi:hypothetical protein [Aurantimonas coralicida]|uniref:hypothetical protein n=1 Tax=Aurantimonas coralicida TaxID=182270 RepID=UPI000AAD6EDA|nr:hypothetical protein [Aurantimonas coralicida]